ncbi:MAG: peptidylprolyl isomerase [Bacteroidota bacterium]
MSWAALGAAIILLASCGASTPGEHDPLLARVHQKELRLSELEGMFGNDATAEDSALVIQAFVNRWSRDAILQWEAERNLPPDLNIDRLVRDYRSSLVSSHYEEVLVKMRLDSTIAQDELEAYYEQHKNQYQLERPIVRCLFIRVPYPLEDEESLQQLWSNGRVEDTTALADYCERFAEVALLDPSAWYSLDDVAQQLPEDVITADNVSKKGEFSMREGSYRYYFRLLEVKPRLEIAPLSYIEEQARKVILHNRKRKVLEEAREEIFDRELRRNNIETFQP